MPISLGLLLLPAEGHRCRTSCGGVPPPLPRTPRGGGLELDRTDDVARCISYRRCRTCVL
jgi:hypothetical protein